MTYPKITTEKGSQSSQDCGPAFCPMGSRNEFSFGEPCGKSPLGGRDGLPCGKPLRSDIVQYVICVGTTRKGRPFPGL